MRTSLRWVILLCCFAGLVLSSSARAIFPQQPPVTDQKQPQAAQVPSPGEPASALHPNTKNPNGGTGELTVRSSDFHLKAGKIYEDLHLWQEAEREYLEVASDESAVDRSLALQGLCRVRSQPQPFAARLQRILKTLGFYALAIIVVTTAVYLIVLALLAFYRSSQCMEVRTFASEADDKLAGIIAVTFSRLRAAISDTLGWRGVARSHGTGAANFPVVLPDLHHAIPLDEQLPDVEIEAGGFKLSKLARLVPLMFRPRFRLVGTVATAEYYAIVHAEIWERHRWFSYEFRGARSKRIPRPPNGDGFVELEVFVYDVLLAVMYATY